MAREIKEIKEGMTANYIADTNVKVKYELEEGKSFEEQFSKVSLESIIFYVVASGIWTLEKLQDIFFAQINKMIAELTPGTLVWYRDKALRFQLGRALPPDKDYYDNTGLSAEDIAKLEVVKQAAATEQNNQSGQRILQIKIAGGTTELQALPQASIKAVAAYFEKIKYAGVLIEIVSRNADKLYGKLRIHYNPTVLDADGLSLNGGDNQPVRQAIAGYLQNLTFNGEFSVMRMIDAIQVVEGVELAHASNLTSINYAGQTTTITDRSVPASGYMRVEQDTDLNITYTPYNEADI